MAYKLVQTDSYNADVAGTVRYLFDALKSPQATATFLDKLESSYLKLENTPLGGSPVLDSILADRGYRKQLVGSYLIIYLVDETSSTVTLMRLFYGAQNYARYL